MPNSEVNKIVQDHRILSDWSDVSKNDTSGNETAFILSIDMVFNSGHQLSIIVYSILMVISAIGNITVFFLLTKRRLRGPSRIDIMLMHLAIADLLVTFLLMPMEIGWAYTVTWEAGDFMCRVMSFFRTFGLYLSSFVLVCISVDRYFAVLKPFKLSDSRGRIMLAVAWFMSIVFSTPQAIIFHVEKHPEVEWFEQCVTFHSFPDEFHNILYSIMGMIIMYALPLIIIIFCYISIYVEIYRKSQKVFKGTERFRRSNDDVLSRAKRRTLKMTVTIVIVFVICWTPFYVMSMWYWFDRETAIVIDQRIQKGLFLFASTNSCMNPIVYGIFNIRSREHISTLNNRHASISKRTGETLSNSVIGKYNNGHSTPRMASNNSMKIPQLPLKQQPKQSNSYLTSSITTSTLNNCNNIPPITILPSLPISNSTTSTNISSVTTPGQQKHHHTSCLSCGEIFELPDLRNLNNVYH